MYYIVLKIYMIKYWRSIYNLLELIIISLGSESLQKLLEQQQHANEFFLNVVL